MTAMPPTGVGGIWSNACRPESTCGTAKARLRRAGINRVVFQLGGFGFHQGSEGESRPGPPGQPREVPPGDYGVTLQVGDRKFTQKARVLP